MSLRYCYYLLIRWHFYSLFTLLPKESNRQGGASSSSQVIWPGAPPWCSAATAHHLLFPRTASGWIKAWSVMYSRHLDRDRGIVWDCRLEADAKRKQLGPMRGEAKHGRDRSSQSREELALQQVAATSIIWYWLKGGDAPPLRIKIATYLFFATNKLHWPMTIHH